MGHRSGEEGGSAQESGFAIMTRQQQSDTGAVSWHDNLNQAIMWQGKIILDLWPKLINGPCACSCIINPDDSIKHAMIYNSQNSDPQEALDALQWHQGLKKAYDVGVGDYDLTLSTGPMYKAARAEAFKAMTAVIAENPEQMLPIVGDIWAKNADFPDADVLAARFKKLLPPQLQDESAEDAQSKLLAAQSQIQQLTQQNNITVQELTRASDTIRTKRLDLESRERVALMNNWTQLMLQRLKSHDVAAQSLMDAQLQTIQQRLVMLHEQQPIDEDAGAIPDTPELPNSASSLTFNRITPAAPTPRPQPIGATPMRKLLFAVLLTIAAMTIAPQLHAQNFFYKAALTSTVTVPSSLTRIYGYYIMNLTKREAPCKLDLIRQFHCSTLRHYCAGRISRDPRHYRRESLDLWRSSTPDFILGILFCCGEPPPVADRRAAQA